jgi:hypothetical protein
MRAVVLEPSRGDAIQPSEHMRGEIGPAMFSPLASPAGFYRSTGSPTLLDRSSVVPS